MNPYPAEVRGHMKAFYDSLSEKDRRRYAAVEAEKLGPGGVEYIASVLGCSEKTVRQGGDDVRQLPEDEAQGRVRKKGGRKKASCACASLDENLRRIVADHTAGDPLQENVTWTYLSSTEIAQRLQRMGTPVCPDTVRGLLGEFGFHKRKAQKSKVMGEVPLRNEQFENIARLKRQYLASPNPIISMDTKKKELLGEFFRAGQSWSNGANAVFDHDFPSYADGKIIPHGLYDIKRNMGHITLGNSHDTSQFACDSFRLWWQRHGRRAYAKAKSILLLCDGGGSNNCRHHIFKEDLQRLVNRIGIPIRVAHYPPHCSKYNPIEHRLFSHVTRAWSGVVFRAMEIVTTCLRRVWTSSGLKVTYAVLDKTYQLARRASDRFLEACPIQFEPLLPDWNYTVLPTAY